MAHEAKYQLTRNAQRIVADSTPNASWDKYGPFYLMIEEECLATGEGLTFEEVTTRANDYNRNNKASLRTDYRTIEVSLQWLEAQGMIERVEVSRR
jgi:hypothetical protein